MSKKKFWANTENFKFVICKFSSKNNNITIKIVKDINFKFADKLNLSSKKPTKKIINANRKKILKASSLWKKIPQKF